MPTRSSPGRSRSSGREARSSSGSSTTMTSRPTWRERLLGRGFGARGSRVVHRASTEVIEFLSSANLPDGVTAVPVTDAAGLTLMAQVEQQAFGHDRGRDPGGHPGPARVRARPDCPGPRDGRRRPGLRGQDRVRARHGVRGPVGRRHGPGVAPTRHLPRARALPGDLAVKRGYTYLTVDASEDSRPILERVGFTRLAVTTPYIWTPPS